MIVVLLLSLWALSWICILWFYRRALLTLWHEPVIKRPVLIFESDDWGLGPAMNADRLNAMAAVLKRYDDREGNRPVVTLGVVLANVDAQRMLAGDAKRYYSTSLLDHRFQDILKAIKEGEAAGVFAAQLHGFEHYWPESLMAAIQTNSAVRDWLSRSEYPHTEELPAHLQSRWADCSTLPSMPLPQGAIGAAVQHETALFQQAFNRPATVVVPPTFLWNEHAESAWRREGVRIVVTPGRRYYARDRDGRLIGEEWRIYNGQKSSCGLFYAVRDDYFEPALGHTADSALAALKKKTELGRPTLLEMHRFNFSGDADGAQQSLYQLDRLLQYAKRHFPDLKFFSTEQLIDGLRNKEETLTERKLLYRIYFFLQRSRELPKLWKIAWLSGAVLALIPLLVVTRPPYLKHNAVHCGTINKA